MLRAAPNSSVFHGVSCLGEHEFKGHVEKAEGARPQEYPHDAADVSEEAVQFNGVKLFADCDLGRRKEEPQS